MSDGPGCPTCGTAVQPDWDWCHGCGFDPEGHRPADWAPTGAMAGTAAPSAWPSPPPPAHLGGPAPYGPAPAGAQRSPGLSPSSVDGWPATPAGTPWTPAVAPAKRSGNALRSALIVFGGLVVIAIVAFFLVGPRLAEQAASTRAGAGAKDPVSSTAADGTFSASLSGAPMSKDQTDPDGSVLHMWGWDGGPNGQMVMWGELPPGYRPELEQQVLDRSLDGAVTGSGVATTVTFAGHAARHFTGTFDGLEGEGVVFIDGNRLYILLAGGPWASQEPQASAFLSSFKLTPAP